MLNLKQVLSVSALLLCLPTYGQVLSRGVALGYEDVIIGKQFGAMVYQPIAKAYLLHFGVTYFVNEDPRKKNPESGYHDYYPIKTLQRFGLRLGIERPKAIRGTTASYSPFLTLHANRMPRFNSEYWYINADTLLPFGREDLYIQKDYVSTPRTIGTLNVGLNLLMPIRTDLVIRIQGGVGLRRMWFKDPPVEQGFVVYVHLEDQITIDRILGVGVEYKLPKRKKSKN